MEVQYGGRADFARIESVDQLRLIELVVGQGDRHVVYRARVGAMRGGGGRVIARLHHAGDRQHACADCVLGGAEVERHIF